MSAHTILIVDDETAILKALNRALQYEGYSIITTPDPEEALAIIQKEKVDLIISDHTMPGMLGIDLLRRTKLLKPEAMRIILTGNADLDMALRAINEGEIYRFMTKPWDNNELLVTVRLALREYELRLENKRLLAEVKRQRAILGKLEETHPGITSIRKTIDGKIIISEDDIRELELKD